MLLVLAGCPLSQCQSLLLSLLSLLLSSTSTYNPADGRGIKKPASQEQAMKELLAVVSGRGGEEVYVCAERGVASRQQQRWRM